MRGGGRVRMSTSAWCGVVWCDVDVDVSVAVDDGSVSVEEHQALGVWSTVHHNTHAHVDVVRIISM